MNLFMNTQMRVLVMDTEHILTCKKYGCNSILYAHVCGSCLWQLHDRNSRRQFADPQDFHARETVDEYFLTQVCDRH